ncbi:MAG: 7-cyano-7-deazaguanine synthase QueC [Pseudomonadota bacterium]
MAGACVCLVSGGLDSAVTLAVAQSRGLSCHALSFDYGQRHAAELSAARRVCASLGAVGHRLVRLAPSAFAASALTGASAVPKGRDEAQMAQGIPETYVPARNTVFLSYALALAETLGTGDLFLGVNAVDYSGYPDCRPEFIAAFETMANLATKAAVEGRIPVRIHAPLLSLAKAEIIRLGASLGVDFSLTLSCYDPNPQGQACGQCDSCILRKKGFAEAGVGDPTVYGGNAL